MFDNIIPCTESLEQVKKVIDFREKVIHQTI